MKKGMNNEELEQLAINEITVNNEETMETPKEKKQQKISISYTLKAMANNTKKLEEALILTKEEAEVLKEIHKNAVNRWIGIEMGL